MLFPHQKSRHQRTKLRVSLFNRRRDGGQWIVWMVRQLERTSLKNSEKMGKKYVGKPLQMRKGCEGILSHMNIHLKVTLAAEGFNNQADKMTCSVNSQLPSLTTLVMDP